MLNSYLKSGAGFGPGLSFCAKAKRETAASRNAYFIIVARCAVSVCLGRRHEASSSMGRVGCVGEF